MINSSQQPQSQEKFRDSKTIKFWDRFAEGNAKKPVEDEKAYQTKLQVTQDRYLTPTSDVVEFGCGTESTSIHHAPKVAHILSTDISGQMIAIAQRKQQEAGISTDKLKFRQTSVDEMDSSLIAPESKDVVLGLSILHLLPNSRTQVISKVHDWLKSGGYFVKSTICMGDLAAQSWSKSLLMKGLVPIGSWLGVLPPLDNSLTKQQLRQELTKAGFSIDYDWQPDPDAGVFIVGKKEQEQ